MGNNNSHVCITSSSASSTPSHPSPAPKITQSHEKQEEYQRWENERRVRDQQQQEHREREQQEREQKERESRERWEREQHEQREQREREQSEQREREQREREQREREQREREQQQQQQQQERWEKEQRDREQREREKWERKQKEREVQREHEERMRQEDIRQRAVAEEKVAKSKAKIEKLRLEAEEQHRAGELEIERIQHQAHEQSKKDQLERERIQHQAHEQSKKDQLERERIQHMANEQMRKDQAEKERIQYEANEQKCKDQAEKESLQQEAEQAKEDLSRGVRPILWPTEEQFLAAKKRVQYDETLLHFAISGPSGSGKSSLINAFRGLRARETGAAGVGTTETTMSVSRYPDLREEPPFPRFVWYDIPGAGTLKFPAWQYFNELGLFIFDFILVVYDMRFTEIDAEILKNCQRFGIPTFIVRSKANQHIRNFMDDEGMDYEDARDEYVRLSQENLENNLKEYGLWSDSAKYTRIKRPRCYIVSNASMYDLVKEIGKQKSKYIDEPALLTDILETANSRRYHVSASENGKTEKDYPVDVL